MQKQEPLIHCYDGKLISELRRCYSNGDTSIDVTAWFSFTVIVIGALLPHLIHLSAEATQLKCIP